MAFDVTECVPPFFLCFAGGDWDEDDNDGDAPSKRKKTEAYEQDLVAKVAPAVAWEPGRLGHDLEQSLDLCKKLDDERKLEAILPSKLPADMVRNNVSVGCLSG